MAKKQQIGPSASIVGASAELFESRSAMPLLESVTEEFGKAIKLVEEEQQRIQDSVNEHMANLKTDIDFTTLEPGMEKEVRRYLLEGKNEYAALANELARLSDASDPRYQEITDRMNEIQQGYSNLAAELGAYNQNKITTAESIRLEEYSKGTDQLGRVTGVYGLDGTKPNMTIKDGHMVFNVNGEEIEYYKMKGLPGVATEVAGFILDTQIAVGKSGVEMTSFERNRYSRVIDDKLRNQDVLGSILSDYPDELPLEDLREKFFDLRAKGELDAAALQEIRTEVKERILTSYDEANAAGVAAAKKAKAAQANPTKPTDKPNDVRFKSNQEIEDVYTQMNIIQNNMLDSDYAKSGPRAVSIPGKPNLQLLYVPYKDQYKTGKKDAKGNEILETIETPSSTMGYWAWFGRSSATSAWKPLVASDGTVETITDARDWYFAATGQI